MQESGRLRRDVDVTELADLTMAAIQGTRRALGGPTPARSSGLPGAHQVVEVGALGLVELECSTDGLEYGIGHSVRASLLEPGIAVDSRTREPRDFLAS